MQFKDFMNLQQLSSLLIKNKKIDIEGNVMDWLKVKCFEYKKGNPYIVGYKYNYFDEYKFIDVRKKNARNSRTVSKHIGNFRASLLIFKANTNKPWEKKDLLKLCKKNVIPDQFHKFFENLPSIIPLKKDRAPEPERSESEEEEDNEL